MTVRPVCLDAGDAVELGELLEFLGNWLVSDREILAVSLCRCVAVSLRRQCRLRDWRVPSRCVAVGGFARLQRRRAGICRGRAMSTRAGVKKVFGEAAKVRRCTIHKRRNSADHLPKSRLASSTGALRSSLPSPTPTRASRRRSGSRKSSRPTTRTRRRRFARDSTTCSPSDASVSAARSPRR